MAEYTTATDGGTAYGEDGFISSGQYFYLGYDGDINNSFILFPCNIPKGYTAEGCTLEIMTSFYTGTSHPPIKIRLSALAVDNAEIPADYAEWQAMQRTAAYFDFEILSYQRFPENLSGFDDVITEIAARPGWEPGNNILLFLDDNGSAITAYNYYLKCYLLAYSVSSRPELHIENWSLSVPIYDTVSSRLFFRCTIADNSAVIPLSNCNIQFRIDLKNSDGETLPAWESTASPFANGYDSAKCLYRLFLSGTVPGFGQLSEITSGLSGFSDLIFEYSGQTVNGVQEWIELAFVRAAMKTATPSEGAQSQSISLYAERENLVSAYTWDYQTVDISGVSFRSPNQSGGKWTYHMAGLITGIKPGWKAVYGDESFVVGEIQWIINATGITTYLKEY
jgi:hypothetical protein